MNKIIVASDSHGDVGTLKDIARIHNDADLYLHLGDSECFEIDIYPFITVRGNCDVLVDIDTRIINFKNHRIYMTHGNRIYLSKENMARIAKKNNCDIFLFGHSHVPYYEIYDNILILNPGAITRPRSSKGRTYAIINIDDNDKIDVIFKNLD